jgi:large subunit ribosomal protein L12
MEYVYAALLLHKLQKEVNEANIGSVVKVKALVAALADINIDDAIKAAPVAVAAAPGAAPAAEAAGEEKKEEKPKDDGKTEEAAMEGLSSLFG